MIAAEARSPSPARALVERLAQQGVLETLIVIVACIAMLAFFQTYADHAVGGEERFGYVSEAQALVEGRLHEQEHVFSRFGLPENSHLTYPIGYLPAGPDYTTPGVPFGYPLLMAALMRLGGFDAAFWVTPLLAAGAVLLTYLLARAWLGRLGGLIAAILAFALPTFTLSAIQPISDTSALFFAALALFALLRPHPRPWTDVLLGFAVGFGIWVRPNLAFILLPPLAWLLYRREFGRLARFGLTLLPFVVVEALVNQSLYGAPWLTGDAGLPWSLSLADAGQRVLGFIQRLDEQQAGLGLVLAGLGFVAGRLPFRLRVLLAGFAVLFVLFFAFHAVDDGWSNGRFLLPGLPALALLEASAVVRLAEPGQDLWLRRAALVGGLVALLWASVSYGQIHGVFALAQDGTKYPAMAAYAREHTQGPALLLAVEDSGSLRFYDNFATMRYDMPLPEMLDALRQVARAGGSVYLVLEDWEVVRLQGTGKEMLLERSQDLGRPGPGLARLFRLSVPQ